MNMRQMVFPIPEGGEATLVVPASVSLETIAALEEASALVFRSLRRNVLKREAEVAGAIEYDSWLRRL